jgi:hypothetical protein
MPAFLLRGIRRFILSDRHADLHCIVHSDHTFILPYSSPPVASCKVREGFFHSRRVVVFERGSVSNLQAVCNGIRFAAPPSLSWQLLH